LDVFTKNNFIQILFFELGNNIEQSILLNIDSSDFFHFEKE